MESINTYSGEAEQAESQEYVQEMVEKAEGIEKPVPSEDLNEIAGDSDRPEWLPEKFNSAEDMAKAYSELETKLSGNDAPQASEVQNMSQDDVAEKLDDAGLNFDAFAEEFIENGTLSDEAYNALEEANIPKEFVDSWLEGQQVLVEQTRSEVFNMVGGEEQYSEIITWASNNLPEHEIDAFNAAIETGDKSLAMLVVQGLSAKYQATNGVEPSLVQGQASTSVGGSYQSVAEVKAAMSDPRYSSDPAYRKTVAEKLARSSVL